MTNQDSFWTVTQAVDRDVNWAVYRAVIPAVYGDVCRDVNGTVHWAVEGAVGRAVQDASRQGAGAQPEEPPHPRLKLYLGSVA